MMLEKVLRKTNSYSTDSPNKLDPRKHVVFHEPEMLADLNNPELPGNCCFRSSKVLINLTYITITILQDTMMQSFKKLNEF